MPGSGRCGGTNPPQLASHLAAGAYCVTLTKFMLPVWVKVVPLPVPTQSQTQSQTSSQTSSQTQTQSQTQSQTR